MDGDKAVIFTLHRDKGSLSQEYEGAYVGIIKAISLHLQIKCETKELYKSDVIDQTISSLPFLLFQGVVIPQMFIVQFLRDITVKLGVLTENPELRDSSNCMMYNILFRLHEAIVFS